MLNLLKRSIIMENKPYTINNVCIAKIKRRDSDKLNGYMFIPIVYNDNTNKFMDLKTGTIYPSSNKDDYDAFKSDRTFYKAWQLYLLHGVQNSELINVFRGSKVVDVWNLRNLMVYLKVGGIALTDSEKKLLYSSKDVALRDSDYHNLIYALANIPTKIEAQLKYKKIVGLFDSLEKVCKANYSKYEILKLCELAEKVSNKQEKLLIKDKKVFDAKNKKNQEKGDEDEGMLKF